MKCDSLEAIAVELARGRPMDAGLRNRATSHVSHCPGCAARLEEEIALTDSLRALAASDADRTPPSSLERELLAQFRIAGTESPGRVSRGNGKSFALKYGVAASIALAVLLTVYFLASRADEPRQFIALPDAPVKVETSATEGNLTETPAGKSEVQPIRHAKPRRAISRRSTPGVQPDPGPGYVIATDFFPLLEAFDPAHLEGGQILRVELLGSDLASLGLPVSPEVSEKQMTADVLIGFDGMAHAIRLVRR